MPELDITYDDHEFRELLEAWEEPNVKKALRAAASKYGKAGKPIIRAATPGPSVPGNKYASPGELQRSVKFKRMRARYGIGVVIAPMGKAVFYRGMVTGGTKPHLIMPKSPGGRLAIAGGFASAVHHPGAKSNPFVGRVSGSVEEAGLAAAEVIIFEAIAEARRVAEQPEEG